MADTATNTEFCAGTCTDVAVGKPGVNGGQGGTADADKSDSDSGGESDSGGGKESGGDH